MLYCYKWPTKTVGKTTTFNASPEMLNGYVQSVSDLLQEREPKQDVLLISSDMA